MVKGRGRGIIPAQAGLWAMARGKNKGEDTEGAKVGDNVVTLNRKVGPGTGKRRGKDELAITVKMETYCQLRASGNYPTKSAAYRLAYDCRNMSPDTVNQEASRLETDPRIVARIDAIKLQKEAYSSHDAAQIRAHVIARLHLESIDPGSPPSARVRALELLGKLGGVQAFEKVSEEPAQHNDSEKLSATLQDKLKGLLSA